MSDHTIGNSTPTVNNMQEPFIGYAIEVTDESEGHNINRTSPGESSGLVTNANISLPSSVTKTIKLRLFNGQKGENNKGAPVVSVKRRKMTKQSSPTEGVNLDSSHAQPSSSTSPPVIADLTKTWVPMNLLLPLIECHVCLDTVKIPFKMCPLGHLTCNGCMPMDKSCPTCEAVIYYENPVCVKNILEALPRRCMQSDCDEIVVGKPGCQHERYCQFREGSCEKKDCYDIRVPIFRLKEHYRTNHKEEQLLEDVSGIVQSNFYWMPGLHEIPVFALDNVFWIEIFKNVKDRLVEISFSASFIGEPSFDYFADLKIENDESAIACKLKASDWEVPNVKKCSMKVSYDSIKQYISNNLLSVCYEICRKPKL